MEKKVEVWQKFVLENMVLCTDSGIENVFRLSETANNGGFNFVSITNLKKYQIGKLSPVKYFHPTGKEICKKCKAKIKGKTTNYFTIPERACHAVLKGGKFHGIAKTTYNTGK